MESKCNNVVVIDFYEYDLDIRICHIHFFCLLRRGNVLRSNNPLDFFYWEHSKGRKHSGTTIETRFTQWIEEKKWKCITIVITFTSASVTDLNSITLIIMNLKSSIEKNGTHFQELIFLPPNRLSFRSIKTVFFIAISFFRSVFNNWLSDFAFTLVDLWFWYFYIMLISVMRDVIFTTKNSNSAVIKHIIIFISITIYALMLDELEVGQKSFKFFFIIWVLFLTTFWGLTIPAFLSWLIFMWQSLWIFFYFAQFCEIS